MRWLNGILSEIGGEDSEEDEGEENDDQKQERIK